MNAPIRTLKRRWLDFCWRHRVQKHSWNKQTMHNCTSTTLSSISILTPRRPKQTQRKTASRCTVASRGRGVWGVPYWIYERLVSQTFRLTTLAHKFSLKLWPAEEKEKISCNKRFVCFTFQECGEHHNMVMRLPVYNLEKGSSDKPFFTVKFVNLSSIVQIWSLCHLVRVATTFSTKPSVVSASLAPQRILRPAATICLQAARLFRVSSASQPLPKVSTKFYSGGHQIFPLPSET